MQQSICGNGIQLQYHNLTKGTHTWAMQLIRNQRGRWTLFRAAGSTGFQLLPWDWQVGQYFPSEIRGEATTTTSLVPPCFHFFSKTFTCTLKWVMACMLMCTRKQKRKKILKRNLGDACHTLPYGRSHYTFQPHPILEFRGGIELMQVSSHGPMTICQQESFWSRTNVHFLWRRMLIAELGLLRRSYSRITYSGLNFVMVYSYRIPQYGHIAVSKLREVYSLVHVNFLTRIRSRCIFLFGSYHWWVKCSLVPRPPCPAFVAFILQTTKAGCGGLGTRLSKVYVTSTRIIIMNKILNIGIQWEMEIVPFVDWVPLIKAAQIIHCSHCKLWNHGKD